MKTVRQFLTELAESKKELNAKGYVKLHTTHSHINSCGAIIVDKTIDIKDIECCFTEYDLDNYKVIAAIEMDDDLYIKVELIENKKDKEIEIL